MSWNNIIPWWVLYMQCNYEAALESCAFANEIVACEFRDDCFY